MVSMEWVEDNLLHIIAVSVLLFTLLCMALYWRSRRAKVRTSTIDVLDEGQGPAKRNEALIKAPSAADTSEVQSRISTQDAAPSAAQASPTDTAAPAPATPSSATPSPAAPSPATVAASPAAPSPAAVAASSAAPSPAAVAASPAAPSPAAPSPATSSPETTSSTATSPKTAPASDLARIKGLGPKLQNMLPTLGVTNCEQIAGWDEADIDRIDAQLGRFSGRIRRDNWVEQAQLLSSGDAAAYAAKFGNS